MEYIDIINKIVEAEQAAQKLSGEAVKKRESLPSDLAAERERLRKSYFERAEKRLENIRRQEKTITDESIAKLEAQYTHEMERLNALYAKNRDIWVEKLFARLTEK